MTTDRTSSSYLWQGCVWCWYPVTIVICGCFAWNASDIIKFTREPAEKSNEWKRIKKQQYNNNNNNECAHETTHYDWMKIGRDVLKYWLYFNWIYWTNAHFLLVSIKTFKITRFCQVWAEIGTQISILCDLILYYTPIYLVWSVTLYWVTISLLHSCCLLTTPAMMVCLYQAFLGLM